MNYNQVVFTIKQTTQFERWARKLKDRTAKALIAARILRLSEGLMGDVQPFGGQVSELRIHYGPGYRVYFTKRGQDVIVLLCGGDKGSQQNDIAVAYRLAAEWNSKHD